MKKDIFNIPKGIAVTGRIQSWLNDLKKEEDTRNPLQRFLDGMLGTDTVNTTLKRLPVSCTTYVVDDSMDGTPNSIENSWLFTSYGLRHAAGVSIHLSNLRPKGTPNKDGLVSSGPTSFAQIYSKLNEILRRGGTFRNGACTLHLDYDHPDIVEFATAPRSDLPWARRAINVDKNFIHLPEPTLSTLLRAIENGDCFLVKKQYDRQGNRIYHNVCVGGDNWVTTIHGPRQVKDLVGIPFSVIVDGNAYPSTDKGFWSTGIQPVFKLKTTQGYNITATADHQILTQSGNWVELQHLKEGDQLRVNSSYNYTSGSAPFTATVSSIEYLGLEEVFDCTINDLHAFDANGLIAHNCLEVLLKNQGSCLLAHVNLGALQIDDIPRAFVEGMEWLCTLHKYTNVHLGGYYLPPSIDKQVGLGVLGLANLLAIEGITYHDLVVSMEELFNMVPEEDTTVPSKEARRLAIVLYEAFQMSARVARKYKMDRCVTANTWIHTIEGPKQVSDLIGIPFTAVVNGLPYESTKHGFWSTGVKPVYRITTTTGYSLTLTDNHPVLVNKKASKTCPKCRIPTTVIRKNGGGKYKNVVGICKSCNYHFKIGQEKPLNNNVWIEVKDLTIGDRLCLNNHRISPEWEGAGGTFEQGWLLGQLLGNGCLHDRSSDNRQATARLQFWGEYKEEMLDKCINYLNTSVDSRFVNSRLKGTKGVDSLYVRSTGLATLAKSVGMMPKQKVLNNSIEKMSSNFYRGFLQGLFDADGSVNLGNSTGSSRKISLAQVNKDTLRCVQRMLLRLGVVSKIYTNSKLSGDSTILLDNGKTHTIKTNNLLSNLIITGDDMIQYASLVGFSKPDKKQKLANMLLSYKQQPNSQSFITEVKSIELIGTEEVYDCTINEAHEFDANGLRVHNCFVVAPTASCSFNNKDREFYTTTPEIAPPVDVIVERDSQTMGVIEVDYHPDCETAEQVGWDVYFRLNCVWQRFMDSTGLAHAISTNWWSDKVRMDKDFIAQWLDSPLKSLYYAWQVSTNTQDKSEVITFDETETESSSTECLPCKELARQQNTECLSCAE